MSLSKNYLELKIQNKIGWAQLEKIKLMSTVCIYKIPCANFDKTYIGKTGRNFGVRLQEHRTKVESKTGRIFTRSLRASSLTEHNKSAHQRIRGFTTMHYINQLFTFLLTFFVTDHATQEIHVINWSQATVINREPEHFTSWIKEAIHIRKEGQQAMNRDEGSYQLSHAYDRFLDTVSSRRVKNQKNSVPASSDEGFW